MPAHVYEVFALAARFWFLFLMVIIVWQTYRWYARDRRLRKKRLETLPDAGYIGEFVLMRPVAGLAAGTAFRVPAEGTLGLLRSNDICLPAAGVADRHLLFRYSREDGICLTPLGGSEFTVDQTPIGDQPGGLYVVHGSRLFVGEAELRLRMFEGYEVLRPINTPAPQRPGSPWEQTAGVLPQGAWVQPLPPYAQPLPDEPGGYAPPQPERQDPYRHNPYAREPQPSPYGQRVRPQLSETRRRRSAYTGEQLPQAGAAAAAETPNPYRSRRSIPGLRREHTGRYRSVAGEHNAVFAPLPDERPVMQASPQPEPAPEKTPAGKGGEFSSMSDYARLMARAAEQQPAQTAEAPQPAAQAAAEPAAKTPAEPQPKQAQQPAQAAAPKTAAQAAVKPVPRPAPKAPEKPAAPTFAPADPQAPDMDMVFEELRPEDSAISDEVVFHPLMDDEDWSDWDEEWSTPAAKPQPLSRATRLAAAKTADSGAYAPVKQTAKPEASMAKPVKAEKPEPMRQPEEEAWPYLSRTGQWQAEELFADLLDEDGTDAASPTRSSWSEDGSEGSTTRRMLQRYFRGGGM